MALTAEEKATGSLFGKLFAAYDDVNFKRSVELFKRRFTDAGFDVGWFRGKACLDAGCGGGRYSIALAHLGASSVDGVDVGKVNIADANRRALDLQASHINFHVGSVAELPFPAGQFDCVICSGVLQHTVDPVRVLDELSRVLRPGGMLYMLVYATEGLRWPLVQVLRPIAQSIGLEKLDALVEQAGLPVNRRRTYLDDLFVPYIDFYTWRSLEGQLRQRGFVDIARWERGRLDHEETIETYAADLEGFVQIFRGASAHARGLTAVEAASMEAGARLSAEAHGFARAVAEAVMRGDLSQAAARALTIGQGHHRLVAWKAK